MVCLEPQDTSVIIIFNGYPFKEKNSTLIG